MDPLVVILTCERPAGFSFVQDVARAVDNEGGRALPRMIVVDGDQADRDRIGGRLAKHEVSDWPLVALGARMGSTLAMYGALSLAAQENRDVLFFEDDVLLCRGAIARMLDVQVPRDCGYITFFDAKEVRPGAPHGLYRYGPRDVRDWQFWGCLALRFPADMVRWLAEQSWSSATARPMKMASDLVLGMLLMKHARRNKVAVHIPCLVQHVGHVSACFPGLPITKRRATANFPGVKFDASSLPAFPIVDFSPASAV